MKNQVIKTISYVHVGDNLVRFDDLDPERKKEAGTQIKTRWMNELYMGEARFWPMDEK